MNKLLLLSLSILVVATPARQVLAGSYGPQTFDAFAAGTSNLGDGSLLGSTAIAMTTVQNRVGGGPGRALRLTQDGVGSTNSSFKLPVFDTASEIETFDASFKLAQYSTDGLADGCSFNFGAVPGGTDYGGGEAGFAMSNGLVISFDTYANFDGDAPRIKVFSNGVQVGIVPAVFNNNDAVFHSVVVHYDANGLDVSYDGTAIFTNLALPGFLPAVGDRFGFSARTGGVNQETQIDDVSVSTTIATPIVTNDVLITEFLADNGDNIEDEDTDSSDWIELYNGTPSPVNLAGWRLTNLSSNLGLWTFPDVSLPPSTYLRVFASGKDRKASSNLLHTNFTLEKSGGYLALVKADGVTKVSEFNYGPQSEDVSYGTFGVAQTPQYLSPPTPGGKNDRVLHADGPPAEDVHFNRDGGLFSGTVSLSVLAPTAPDAVVRYTLDGTIPDEADPVFNPAVPLAISATKYIRARVFQPGHLPGDVSTRTFLLLDASLTNYANKGQPFSSNLPIIVMESWGTNLDADTNPAGPRPYRPVFSVVLGTDAANGNRAKIDGLVNFQGRGGMHVRGQTSSSFGQKPYAWETWNNEDQDKSVPLLGLPSDSDWVLQTPYNDKSLMRNSLPYGLMQELNGSGSSMRCKFVEVFINQNSGPITYADYRGVYVLMEHIKRSSDRVDLSELSPLANDPATITGGYIFKKDKLPESPMYNTTSNGSWGAQTHEIVEPGDASAAQIAYLQNYVQQFDNALSGANFADPATGYQAYIDVTSFIDNHLWTEIFKQIDGYRISTYYSKERGQKIRALPIWDYNLSGGNANYFTGDSPIGWYYSQIGGGDYPYYPRLLADPNFKMKYWDRYWQLRRTLFTTASVHAHIDAWKNQLTDNLVTNIFNGASISTGQGDFFPTDKANNLPPSQESSTRPENPASRHFDRWPILGVYVWPNPNGYETRTTYQSEVQWMKDWFANRLAWIDSQNSRPPTFSATGGITPTGTSLTITNPNASGTIYYTTDGSDPAGELGSAVSLIPDSGAPCTWLVPTAANGGYDLTAGAGAQQWTNSTDPVNVANWVTATTGIGYDSSISPVNYLPLLGVNGNNDAQAHNINATCYIRVAFTIPDQAALDAIGSLNLGMKYDDGFRAYLNGTFIVGRNDTHASVTSTPWIAQANIIHDDTAALSFEDIDVTTLGRPALHIGVNVLAIHALNSPGTSTDFLMVPRLTYVPAVVVGGSQVYSGPLTIDSSVAVTSRVFISGQWSPVTIGSFIVNAVPVSSANLVVSEFCYNPPASGVYSSKDLEFLVLRNIGASSVDLTGVGLRGGANFTLAGTPQDLTLPSGGEVVLAANPTALTAVHGAAPANVKVFGPFTGALGNSGDTIRIETVSGAVIKEFSYATTAPWPNGTNRSLVLLQPQTNPDHRDGHHWRSSVAPLGTPYSSDSVGFTGDWLADTDHDGYADGIEYALGSVATDATSKPSIEASVANEVVATISGKYLRLTVRRSLLNDEGTLVPQLSEDLVNWVSGSAAFTRISQTNHGDGTVTEVWRSTNPLTGDKAFGRLSLSSP